MIQRIQDVFVLRLFAALFGFAVAVLRRVRHA